MFDFGRSFATIARLEGQYERAKSCATIKQVLLVAEVDRLLAPLRVIALSAISEYNNTISGYHLSSEGVSVSVSREKRTLSLSVRVKGAQPNDEWDFDEAKTISERFEKVMKAHLVRESIPLAFGELRFPSSYYLK